MTRPMVTKKAGALLALLLFVAMVLVPSGASRAGGSAVSVSLSLEKAGDKGSRAIYSLCVNALSPQGLSVMTSVISYDRSLVVPVNRNTWSDIPGLVHGGSLGALEAVLKDRAGSAYGLLGFWFQGEARDGFLCDLYSTAPLLGMATSQPVYAFYFRLADGVTEEELTQEAFRVETDKSPGSLLAAIYKTPDALEGATGLGITDKAPGGDTTYRYSPENGGAGVGASVGVSFQLLAPKDPVSEGGSVAVPSGDGDRPSGSTGFVDVGPSDWFHDAVAFLVKSGITQGTSPTTFSPLDPVTRGQLLVLVMRAYDIEPDAQARDNFADAGNTYYTLYLSAAKRLGIVDGVGDNRFEPERPCTRQEMFKLVYGALGAIGKLPAAAGVKSLGDFADKADVADWAVEAAQHLVSSGIISGSGGGMLIPLETSTRAEMAQILTNLLSR